MISYHDSVKGMKNIFNLRFRLAMYANEHGVSKACREFKTTPKTVRKWRDRFNKENLKGLKDRSRKPNSSPSKIPVDIEVKLMELRERHPKIGPQRLKDFYDGIPSNSTCYRVWHEKPDLMKPKPKNGKNKKT